MWLKKVIIATLILVAAVSIASCGGAVGQSSNGTNTSGTSSAAPNNAATQPFSITTASLPNATLGTAYSTTLAATGGQSPYKWSLTSGTLPTGITLSNAGVLAGTPAQSGTFNFTVSAADSEATPLVASQSLSLVVQAPLSITTTSLPSGQVNTAYNAAVAASGGATPYSWSIYSGALPTGISLASSTGVISGTPSVSGAFNVTLAVQDAQGASMRFSFSITIAAVVALQITTASLPNGIEGLPYDATVSVAGGTPPYTWSLISGTLPSSIALAATTGEIDGTPTASGTFTPTLQVADSANNTASKPLPLTITTSSGPVMRSGSGAPLNSIGSNGDLYHRTDVPSIYGPKASGSWPAAYSVILGRGCTTAYHIDWGCSGYGVGTDSNDPNPLFGQDAGIMGNTPDTTVHTSAQVLAKYTTISAFLTAIGYPTNRIFYVATTGSDTGGCGSVGSPCASYNGLTSTLSDLAGGTVLYRAGTYSTSVQGPGASSSSNPLVFMAYPGELVQIQNTYAAFFFNSAWKNAVYDGFIASRPDTQGNGVEGYVGDNNTFRNIEFFNFTHAVQPSGSPIPAHGPVLERLVMRSIGTHALYPTCYDCMSGATQNQEFNFAAWWSNPVALGSGQYGPFYNLVLRDSIVHGAGSGGFEPIHINTLSTGTIIERNIVWGNGGTGIKYQNGAYNSLTQNNVVFSNSMNCFELSNYDYADPSIDKANMMNHNAFINNTCFTGSQPSMTGSWPPYYGVHVLDYSDDLPVVHYIKNTTIKNNIVVVYNDGTSSGYPNLEFEINSFPDTDLIQNNLLYNVYSGNSSSAAMRFAANSLCSSSGYPYSCCTGAGTGTCATASTLLPEGSYSFSQLQSYNTGNNSNNLWGDPKFTDAQLGYYATPSKFSFILQPGSPAIGAGTATGAPSTDITGATRANPPSIGAYE